ncbi:hypothetical protein [Holospora elegans]|uniref:hypothetical protein n=1 Tax=Holospora elegans TaxID=431043 RepID=UPI0013924097|nr:hypothetical protein [Holospora elegans]
MQTQIFFHETTSIDKVLTQTFYSALNSENLLPINLHLLSNDDIRILKEKLHYLPPRILSLKEKLEKISREAKTESSKNMSTEDLKKQIILSVQQVIKHPKVLNLSLIPSEISKEASDYMTKELIPSLDHFISEIKKYKNLVEVIDFVLNVSENVFSEKEIFKIIKPEPSIFSNENPEILDQVKYLDEEFKKLKKIISEDRTQK